MGSSDDILQGLGTPGLYDQMFNNLRHPNALSRKPPVAPAVAAKPTTVDPSTGVRTPKASPLLGTVPGLSVSDDLKVPPFRPFSSDKTPANANDTRNFTPPASVPDTVEPLPSGQEEHDRAQPQAGEHTPGQWPGPFTSDLALKSGFSKEEAADWASLANWMTRGESERDPGAFTELFGGDQWQGGNKDHPYYLGWSGTNYNGSHTSAALAFQDEAGTWHNIAEKYLKGDTTTTPENQMKGNLLMAADLYRQRTGGRNILADFKSGNVMSIASNLADQWPTLFGARGQGQREGDAAFHQYQALTKRDIEEGQVGLERLMKLANQADPMSEEMRAYLHRAIETGDELSKHYRDLMEKPPTAKSPAEAAGAMAPLLILFSALGGFASRRPALAAMNAMNGALEGLKQGNDEQFSNNVSLWKTHTTMAKEAFDMQNSTIRNIMDDINLTDREKQNKLQDAFRFWQMDQDLKLARENQWKEVWQRQDQREDRAIERQRVIAQTDEAFARAQRLRADIDRGSYDKTGTLKAEYDALYDKFEEDNQRPPTKKEQADLTQQALDRIHTTKFGLSAPQQQKNREIAAAQDYIGVLPGSFDDDVAAAQADPRVRMDDDELLAKGYTRRQAALYKGLLKNVTDVTKSPADADLIKRYQLSRQHPFEERRVISGEGAAVPTATPTGPVGAGGEASGFTRETFVAAVQQAIDNGQLSPDEAKAKFTELGAEFGLSEDDFDALIKLPGQTPTGPVGGGSTQMLVPGQGEGYIGLAPGL